MTADKKQNEKKSLSNIADENLIRDLADLLEETNLTEIEIERDNFRVRVARHITTSTSPNAISQGSATATPGNPAPPGADSGTPNDNNPAQPDYAAHPGVVASPMVGTAYVAAKPGDPPFVVEGNTVNQGDTLLIIEAMKTMNPIPAPRAGKIAKILFSNAQPVEFGEPLLIIE